MHLSRDCCLAPCRRAPAGKIHLFDAPFTGLVESKQTVPGADVVACDSAVGKLGVTVCYDALGLQFSATHRHVPCPWKCHDSRGPLSAAVPAAALRTRSSGLVGTNISEWTRDHFWCCAFSLRGEGLTRIALRKYTSFGDHLAVKHFGARPSIHPNINRFSVTLRLSISAPGRAYIQTSTVSAPACS